MPDQDTNETSLSFGRWLQEQRTKRDISLEEIAAVTKVHIAQLKNIEEDSREKLPASAFVRGFLLSYARHLGLNEDEVLARYKEATSGNPPGRGEFSTRGATRAAQSASQPRVRLVEGTHLSHAPGTKDLERPKPEVMKPKNWLLLSGGLAALIGLTLLISIGKRSKPTESSTKAAAIPQTEAHKAAVAAPSAPVSAPPSTPVAAPTPSPTKAQPSLANGTAPAPTAEPTSAPVGKKFKLELKPLEQSWVNVRIDDGESSGTVVSLGKQYSYDADRKVVLSLSDAGAVEIRWNGVLYDAPGFRGDVQSLTLPEQLSKLKVKTTPSPAKRPIPQPIKKPIEASPEAAALAPATTTSAPAETEKAPASAPVVNEE